MKVVILAGGYGTRISEESHLRPKPMIEIGGMPILWHIMKRYYHFGFSEFIICAGYKQHMIKEWFSNYAMHTSDVTFDFSNGMEMIVHKRNTEKWKVTIVNTGLNTMTGGRIKRIQRFINNEPFFLTYGDGVSDVDILNLKAFHENHGKILTLTSVSMKQQKGILDIDSEGNINSFREKEDKDGAVINGGFMVCNPEVFDFIDGDDTVFESDTMVRLAKMHELKGYYHSGFWQCMDTKREMDVLEQLWSSGKAPWKNWEEINEKHNE